MIKNGAQVIHLATGLVVGYPPCPYIETFTKYLKKRFNVKVVVGTHSILKKYLEMHSHLGTWIDPKMASLIEPTISNKEIREQYN